jgi:hypothetical protein
MKFKKKKKTMGERHLCKCWSFRQDPKCTGNISEKHTQGLYQTKSFFMAMETTDRNKRQPTG